jgi:homoprotocatechuate degradation regulator HpaR
MKADKNVTPARDRHAIADLRYPPTGRSLPIALLRARERVMGPIREMLADAEVTEQQWRVLRVLDEYGPLPISAVGDLACLQPSSLSRIVQTLVEKGLVQRLRDEADRRRQTISPTAAGAAIIYANIEESRRITTAFEERLGRDKHRQLLDLLDELNRVDL